MGDLDHADILYLRRNHPAWRLLAAETAPLVIGFLHRAFIAPNARAIPETELETQLDDYLYALRDRADEDPYPRPAREYLAEWAGDERGWLRRYYPAGSDEPCYDLLPATEKAIHWVAELERGRQFVATESRLRSVFDLLRELIHGAETDPQARLQELERQRAEIDAEMERLRAGEVALMDPVRQRERFLQAEQTARGLLADFRQVEQNFRDLDRQVRERIAMWEGSRGELLEEIFGEQDAIADSDQGRSFRAFWDFLMSPVRQEELTELLERALHLETVQALDPDPRIGRIHYDWLEAGETTQRTVAQLSHQLRRYLDDQAWLENRRIMDLIREIEHHAVAVRDEPPREALIELDEASPRVELPMERPLFTPPFRPQIADQVVAADGSDVDASELFEQTYVDRDRLRRRIRRALQERRRVALGELLAEHPLEQGLAELVTYLAIATDEARAVVDETRTEAVTWTEPETGRQRCAHVPAVTFLRSSPSDPTAGAQ